MDQIVIKESDIITGIINKTNPILLLKHKFYDDVNYGDLYTIIPTLTSQDFTEFKMYIVFQDDNEEINDSIYIEWHRTGDGLKKIQINKDTNINYLPDFNYLSLSIYNTTGDSLKLKIALKKTDVNTQIFTNWHQYLQAAQTYIESLPNLPKNLPIEYRFEDFKRLLLPPQPPEIHHIDYLSQVDDDDDKDWSIVDEVEGGKLRKQRKSRKRKNIRKRKKSRKQRKSKTRRKSRKRR